MTERPLEECILAPERLAALDVIALAGTGLSADLDGMAHRAAALFDAPMGFVTLVNADRLCFPGVFGPPMSDQPLDRTYCPRVVQERATVVCVDSTLDDRFAEHPATVDGGVRFYVGAPIWVHDQIVGTVCVADSSPRPVTSLQVSSLNDVAAHVGLMFSLRACEREAASKAAALDQLVAAVGFTSGLMRTDARHRVSWMSDRMEQILGLEPGHLIGRSALGLLSAETKQSLADVDGAQPFYHEHEQLLADGSRRWMESSVVPLVGDIGEIHGHLTLARDVTERRRAETMLGEREQMLSTLVDNLPGVVFRAGANTFQMVAGPVQEMFGISTEELLASNTRRVIHPDDVEWVNVEIMRAVESGGRYEIRHRALRDGEVRWVWSNGRAARSGRRVVVEGLLMDITDEMETARRLRDSERRYRHLVDHSPDPVTISREGLVLYANQAAADLVQVPVERLIGAAIADFGVYVGSEPFDDFAQSEAVAGGVDEPDWRLHFTAHLRLPGGAVRELEVRAVHVDWDGRPAMQSIMQDVTARSEVQRSQSEQNLVLDAIARGEPLIDVMERLVHTVERRRPGTDCSVVLFDDNGGAQMVTSRESSDMVQRFTGAGWEIFGADAAACLKAGESIVIQDSATGPEWVFLRSAMLELGYRAGCFLPIDTDAGVVGVLALSQRRPGEFDDPDWQLMAHFGRLAALAADYGAARARLQHEATHDHLTGLPNRGEAVRSISAALVAARATGERIAVLFLDLDSFKLINDTYGHAVGDQVIVAVADMFRRSVRDGDLVARIAGDEFVICCRGAGERDLHALVERIRGNLSNCVMAGDTDHHVDASIGIATSEQGLETAEELLAQADAAMYEAKAAGGGAPRRFGRRMKERVRRRLSLEGALRRALDRDEMVVHYQPEVCIATGEVLGAEALVRWEHPEEGRVAPADFIPIAERTGLIVPLGELVLRRACAEAARWNSVRSSVPLSVSVNVSARQLAEASLMDTVASALRDHGLPPHLLTLELTETSMMQDLESAERALGGLRDLGVRLAIDDFGTGWSSFTYLKRFDMDVLKIDRTFIAGVADRVDDRAIVDAIAALALALDMEVVAEGVETVRQRQELLSVGVASAQGFLWSRPLTAEVFDSLVLRGSGRLELGEPTQVPERSSRLREAMNVGVPRPKRADHELDALLRVLGGLVTTRQRDVRPEPQ
ncbi:MAG: diguanylate cyclase/phosphodiesterase with and sensor(s) [Acidimicrobiia bacterium]|nr:diguanylate cyclase/phosphodiesterase with and sensor(s) [Acidimicrobiia bacterium]